MMISGSSTARIVTLRRNGQFLIVRPAVPDLNSLKTVMTLIDSESQQACMLKRKQVLMVKTVLDELDRPVSVFHAGLEPVVVKVLEKAGYEVRRREEGSEVLPAPDLSILGGYEHLDWALLNHIRRRNLGLVRIDEGKVSSARLIAQIAQAWPRKRMLVLVTTYKRANALRKSLLAYTPNVSVVTCREPYQDSSPITVATPGSLGMVGIEKCDIIVVPNAPEALRPQMYQRLNDAHRARLYGFVARHAHMSPLERDQIAQMFGLREVIIPRHGYVELPIEYMNCRITGGPAMPKEAGISELISTCVWRHPQRNRKAAQLARAFCIGGPALLRLLPTLPRSWGLAYPRRVLLLVEGLEHALNLSRKLPDWPIIVGKDCFTSGIPENQRAMIRSAAETDPGQLSHGIVTASGAERINLTGVDVVIRADGGVGLPPLPFPRCIEVPWDRIHRLLLVDFRDQFHPQLRLWSKSRLRAYDDNGWMPVGAELEEAMVNRFLDSRPNTREST